MFLLIFSKWFDKESDMITHREEHKKPQQSTENGPGAQQAPGARRNRGNCPGTTNKIDMEYNSYFLFD